MKNPSIRTNGDAKGRADLLTFSVAGGKVVCGDALEFLSRIQPGCADIVFLDPPFNLGKRYGASPKSRDLLSDMDYSIYIKHVLVKSIMALAPGGALFLYHIPKWAVEFAAFLSDRLTFRHWIAVSMKNGFVRGDNLYPAHYALLYFTKGEPRHFCRPKILPAKCRHCGGFVKDYGGYRHLVEKGINLSDVWEDLSPVRHRKYKNRQCNELPVELMDRVVKISGRKGGVLIDPFAGTGTALLSARIHGLRFIGCDVEYEYCRLMMQRLSRGGTNGRTA